MDTVQLIINIMEKVKKFNYRVENGMTVVYFVVITGIVFLSNNFVTVTGSKVLLCSSFIWTCC